MIVKPHKMLRHMDVCDRCGITSMDIMEGASTECAAPDNAVSLEARRMQKRMDDLTRPILARLGIK